MKEENLEVINIVQQALRQLMIGIAYSTDADFERLGNFLIGASTLESIDPIARNMLNDLAAGATMIASGKSAQQ